MPSTVKESPLFFNAPMVRAVLDGRKSQTRRVMTPQPSERPGSEGKHWWPAKTFQSMLTVEDCALPGYEGMAADACPLGGRGDRLWVREATEIDEQTSNPVALSRYSADRAPVLLSGCGDVGSTGTIAHWDYSRRTRPSIHMPRWACRLVLEIVNVRLERLQALTEVDAVAEGVGIVTDRLKASAAYGMYYCQMPDGKVHFSDSAVELFRRFWIMMDGAESWDGNPWVWVLEFKRLPHETTQAKQGALLPDHDQRIV